MTQNYRDEVPYERPVPRTQQTAHMESVKPGLRQTAAPFTIKGGPIAGGRDEASDDHERLITLMARGVKCRGEDRHQNLNLARSADQTAPAWSLRPGPEA